MVADEAGVVRPLRRWLVRLVIAGVVLFGALQLVPYGRDHDNPPVTGSPVWPSAASEELARGACYDCHSNETEWPWYSHVAPMSWLVQRDVDRGREAVNFSEWSSAGGAGDEVDELHDAVEDRSMPPRQYTFTHAAARLSDAERELLVDALRAVEDQVEGDDRDDDGGDDNSGPGSSSGSGRRDRQGRS